MTNRQEIDYDELEQITGGTGKNAAGFVYYTVQEYELLNINDQVKIFESVGKPIGKGKVTDKWSDMRGTHLEITCECGNVFKTNATTKKIGPINQ